MHKTTVNVLPFIHGSAVANLHCDVLEVLLISCLRHFRDYLTLVNVLLQGQQYLAWIDRLDEIVGYLRTYGLVHDVLLLTLCHHDNGCGGLYVLYHLQRFQSGQARHHLVQQDEVEGLLSAFLYGVRAVADRCDIVAFLLKKYDMGFKEFNLVIHP